MKKTLEKPDELSIWGECIMMYKPAVLFLAVDQSDASLCLCLDVYTNATAHSSELSFTRMM